MVNIQIAIHRYFSIKNKAINNQSTESSVKNKKKFIIYQILIIIVLIVFLAPYICLFQIKQLKIDVDNTTENMIDHLTNQSKYNIEMSKFATENKYLVVIQSVLQIVVHSFNLVIMITFSVLTVLEIIKIKRKCEQIMKSSFKIRRLMNRNLKLKEQVLNRFKRKEIQIAKMVLYISLIFIMNESSAVITSSLETYKIVNESKDTDLINYTRLTLFFIYIISNTVNFFIYRRFSRIFDTKIKQLFSSIFKSNESKILRSSIIRSRHTELQETRFRSYSMKYHKDNNLYMLHKASIRNKPKRIQSV